METDNTAYAYDYLEPESKIEQPEKRQYLNAIMYGKFEVYSIITKNHTEQFLLDRILFHWQNSRYIRKGRRWFSHKLNDIAKRIGISKRHLIRLLNKLTKEGWIEKLRAKLGDVPRLFLKPTNKLLALIKPKEKTTRKVVDKKIYPSCKSDTMSLSSNIEKECKNNSTVITNSWTKKEQKKKITIFDFPLEKIETELNPRQRRFVAGMLRNLEQQHQCRFSNPAQLLEEIAFSITNPDFHFTNAKTFTHRVNTCAEKIREKKWRTPKGFYNHSEAGRQYRENQVKTQEADKDRKQAEIENAKFQPILTHPADSKRADGLKTPFKRDALATENRKVDEIQAKIERLREKITTMSGELQAMAIETLHRYMSELHMLQSAQ